MQRSTATELYRELNEPAAFQALQQRLLALVIARHGPLHPLVLGAQVKAAEAAYRAGDLAGAATSLGRAAEAVPLLRLAVAGHARSAQHEFVHRRA